MQRHLLKKLLNWKEDAAHKPMMLRGIRQVGKTWLMKELGTHYFKHLVYVNCDSDSRVRQIFEGDYDVHRILSLLEVWMGVSIIPGETLLVLDEIQEIPRAVTSLKYFWEEAPQYHIMVAGSLLGVASLEGTGFPVGCIDFLDVHPLTFTEFLEAAHQERLSEMLQEGNWGDILIFKEKLVEYLRYYYFTGGMPEAVAAFADKRDFRKIRSVQHSLLRAYENDFAKHAPRELVARIRQVWNALPSQLARENRKFVFGALRKGARSTEFELAIQWLCDAGLVHCIYCASKPDVPLSAYKENAFKLFPADVGLLSAQSGLDYDSLLSGNSIFEEFKGALTEQYVLQQLVAECTITPFYWASRNSQCEIDFLYQIGKWMIPHEVKAEENLRSRSLMIFSRKYGVKVAVRTSMADFRCDGIPSPLPAIDGNPGEAIMLLNIPLYAICRLKRELEGLLASSGESLPVRF